jgi:hypothetical protein
MKRTNTNIKTDMSNVSPQEQLDIISLAYINSKNIKYTFVEMEAKFGTRGVRKLTKLDLALIGHMRHIIPLIHTF